MNIKLPGKLEELLDENYSLDGFVKSSLAEFIPWLKVNNLKFFTEYTDHSLEHILKVLETSVQLIREKCWGMITAADAAVLIMAAFLHDCAMHLTEDGFKTLITSDTIVPGFGDKPWLKLWEDFIAEARRFSGRKLMSLFGNPEAFDLPPSEPDKLSKHIMTPQQLLLIGEFLRRHHHRLAHEIALYGVPGPDGKRLKLPDKEETKHIVNLSGVVARSHGMSMRDCLDYLNKNFGSIKTFRGAHPVFLMALLRLADILQLQSDRAPQQIQQVRNLNSPISQGEWEMHQAIVDINWEETPETVRIQAEPKNARTFIRIKIALKQIQDELDSSWTVMGEAYYGIESLRELGAQGLKIRRVSSNLDDVEAFGKTVDYVPTDASFQVADSDMLKLLIKPLYGDHPTFGIRELMQNAIDAVLERQEYIKKYPEFKDVPVTEQDAEVVISFDQDENGWYVTVSDQGIGMTVDTVKNYFLKAGASLRRSEIWRKTFEDEEGKSQVLRSGRFGVGALAAFLLGNEVEVETRHIGEPEDNGLSFSTELDTETIELRKSNRPAGTTIKIRIEEKVIENFFGTLDVKENKWSNEYCLQWYCLPNPRVLILSPDKNELKQRFQLPTLNAELPLGWNRISHPAFQDIHWTYYSIAPDLTCNGIIITEDMKRPTSSFYSSMYFDHPSDLLNFEDFRIKIPEVSVFDYSANLPINLSRTSMETREYPFHEELIESILKDFIAYQLVNAPHNPLPSKTTYQWCKKHRYPGVHKWQDEFFPWYFTKSGISLLEGFFLNEISVKSSLNLTTTTKNMHHLTKLAHHQLIVISEISIPNDFKEGRAKPLMEYAKNLSDLLMTLISDEGLQFGRYKVTGTNATKIRICPFDIFPCVVFP